MPSATFTKAPKGTSLVTVPWTMWEPLTQICATPSQPLLP